MTAEEYIKKEYGDGWLIHEWQSGDVIDAMQEYGKYCAEQAWYHAASNSLEDNFDIMDFKIWWNKFKKQEDEKSSLH